ncbi:MAG: hypothetical protein JSV65_13965 [Armatimonadota bacterium]|nr:MAG: hypothetical protein JSV65_13965 [Armatimonadota bacterium]
MGLLYKPDWEETKERYLAWWAGAYFGRCALAVTAPRADARDAKPPTAPSDPVQRWTDLDYIAALNDYQHATTFYGGEAFPIWHGGYPGHTAIPAFLGCPITLDHTTGWWDAILDAPDWDVTALEIDPDNRWWQFTGGLLHTAAQAAAGKSIPSIGAFGGSGDTLAALRETGRLLYDVVDHPDRVLAAELHLMRQWCEVYDEFHGIIRAAAQGSTCWFPLWSPGRFYASQCDFSYMISPRMFRDLFLPAIEVQTRFLDHAVYHLDGIGAFAHLPALLEVPGIQAIQVLPGAGKPSPLHYLEVLKHVQAGGRNLHISIPAEEVETALSLLSARGLFIDTSCRTEEEARDLLRLAERWSRP